MTQVTRSGLTYNHKLLQTRILNGKQLSRNINSIRKTEQFTKEETMVARPFVKICSCEVVFGKMRKHSSIKMVKTKKLDRTRPVYNQ